MAILFLIAWLGGCALLYSYVEDHWKEGKEHEASKTNAGVLAAFAWTGCLVWLAIENPWGYW